MAPRLAAAARHESGHAVMALRLGRRVERLAIDDDCSGTCRVGAPDYARTRENAVRAAREQLLIVLAGAAVERRGDDVGDWWRL